MERRERSSWRWVLGSGSIRVWREEENKGRARPRPRQEVEREDRSTGLLRGTKSKDDSKSKMPNPKRRAEAARPQR